VTADRSDGTMTVRDKRTGRVLPGLNRFVDGGDRGDSYAYWAPERDGTVDTPAKPPAVDVAEDGPARFTLEIRSVYRLPRSLNGRRKARSAKTVECAIRSRVSLYPGVRRVDFWTEVDNQALDHRLRVHFPTDVQAEVTHAEQHFGVVARPAAAPAADETWMEDPVATYPQKSFVDVSDSRQGVLLANRGLPEYGTLAGVNGLTLALTLLRSVGWLCRADMTTRKGLAGPPFIETPDAQCLGRHVFEYSLIPHEGEWLQAFAEAHRFANLLRARSFAATGGSLPPQGAFLEVTSSRLVLSGLKFAENGSGVVARLYNIGDRAVRARVRLVEAYQKAELVDLNERLIAELSPQGGWVEVKARRNEIVSLFFRMSM
ncbi:MAG: glycoside hydrolase family 38 C-terminal domain-containing protein, partial [Dehalococcoidia bacterium]